MKFRWSPEAAADFAGIIEHIHNKIHQRVIASHTPFTILSHHSNHSPTSAGQAELMTHGNSS